TVNGRQITYNFSHWSDGGNENPRTFYTSHDLMITAYMKGHLVSNSVDATAKNNSRKVVVDNLGNWHSVYEDNGHIYYTYSINNGNTWQPEVRVSEGLNNNSHPNISTDPSSNVISVLWDSGQEEHHVYWRRKFTNDEWSEIYSNDDLWPMGAIANTTPVGIGGDPLYILCNHPSIGVNYLELYIFQNSELNALAYIQSPNEMTLNPVISQATHSGNMILHIGWEDENQIFYTSYYNGSLGEIEEVTDPDIGIEINTHPSLSVDLGEHGPHVNVVWSGFDVGLNAYVLLHRQRGANPYTGQWGELDEVYYSYSDISNPNLGSFTNEDKPGWFDVAFNFNDEYIRSIQYQVDRWRWLDFWENGKYPSFGDQTNEMMLVWTDHTAGLPYLVKHEFFSEGIPEDKNSSGKAMNSNSENIPQPVEKHYRKEIFNLSSLSGLNLSGTVKLTLGDIRIQTADRSFTWRFIREKDTLNPVRFMQTEPICVTPDMRSVKFHFQADVSAFSFQQPLSNQSL
ncbi:MAG: hypothetical protein P8048_12940, partial [Calditrichia bacterium]